MPTSTRKSSIGISTRRASQQKGYIPYRGDNPEVGKKTGIAVRHVERKSDGFEPFEEVMRQADARTPPRPKSKKQKVQLPSIDDDEDGEMSMELDDNNNTPLAYLKNTRQQPLSANRVGSSSRPVGRPSLIDYDQIPSPGPLSNRFSIASTSAGPSNLSKAYAPGDDDDDDDDDNIDFNDGPPFDPDDVGTVHNDDSDELPQAIDTQKLSRRSSFAAIDQDDDDHDAPPDPPDPDSPSPPRLNGKGKGRATEEDMEVDNEMEEDISRGLGEPEDMNEDEPEPEPQVVKPVAKRGRPPGKRPAKEPRRSSTPPAGVRRSKRYKFRPLEWWRQERVVYGRGDASSGPILVPHIKEVITIPKEVPLPLTKKRGRAARARSKSKVDTPEPVVNPEDGWDDKTPSHTTVIDFTSGEEVERRIAYTQKMLNPHTAANADWMFEKVFGDDEFIAAGELLVPPGCRKPSKPTKDNTYVFFVIEGAINLRIHNSSLILASGAMFMVPRGNTYYIENICQRTVRLFFTQARKMAPEDAPPLQDLPIANGQTTVSAIRSSSAGATVPRKASQQNALKRAASTRI